MAGWVSHIVFLVWIIYGTSLAGGELLGKHSRRSGLQETPPLVPTRLQ